MKKDEYGLITLDQNELLESLYTGKITDFEHIITDHLTASQFNSSKKINGDDTADLSTYQTPMLTVEQFDMENQKIWFMPKEYMSIDIEDYVIKKCSTEKELLRVKIELELFKQKEMLYLLKYLIYLIDTMKKHKIVWGVGRGSSVASYILFLLGIHKIDSIKYDLDIKEFLK